MVLFPWKHARPLLHSTHSLLVLGTKLPQAPSSTFHRPLAWPHSESRAVRKQLGGQPHLQDRESESQEPGRPGYLSPDWGLPLPGRWGGPGSPSMQHYCPGPRSWLRPVADLCNGQWAERVQSQKRSPKAVNREVLREAWWEGAMGSPGGEGEGSWSASERMAEEGQA